MQEHTSKVRLFSTHRPPAARYNLSSETTPPITESCTEISMTPSAFAAGDCLGAICEANALYHHDMPHTLGPYGSRDPRPQSVGGSCAGRSGRWSNCSMRADRGAAR